MRKYKKLVAMIACISIIFSISGCSNTGGNSGSNGSNAGASEDTKYSWWIYQGESAYYDDYRDNPGVNYWLTKTYGPDNKAIDLQFVIPVSGSERDNFNTLIATGEYPDLMDLMGYSGTVKDLYNDGIALDITEYVEKYMPNYMAYLDARPDLKATAMNVIDGEKKFLGIYGYNDGIGDMWGGFEYRRDWIIKYGKNPKDGSSFSGKYTGTNEDGTTDLDSWEDNVVFPSGGPDPIYISDWEWMLGIFKTALEDQKISDGYCMSVWYPGFYMMGELIGGFGTAGWWNVNQEGKIGFGPTTEGFRAYLQCMSTWYKNGWVDTAFAERVRDQFFQIDDATVRQGKVGLWYGLSGELGGKLDNGEGYLDGIVVAAAPQPINDIYGTAEQQNHEPAAMYQDSLEVGMTVVTSKVKEKDIPTLFSFLDYMYSDEAMVVKSLGLNKEQYEVTKDKFYTEQGLTDGAYVHNEDGTYQFAKKVQQAGSDLESAVAANRIIIGSKKKDGIVRTRTEFLKHNYSLWTMYTNTTTLRNSFISQLAEEDTKNKSKVETNCLEFVQKNVPNFINGKKDPYNDDDWNAYLNAFDKYNPDSVTKAYQALYDSLK